MWFRLTTLYLRTRLAALAMGLLVGMTAATWLLLKTSYEDSLDRMLFTIAPLALAITIVGSIRFTLGEVERSSTSWLPVLRLVHLLLLLGGVALVLTVANVVLPVSAAGWMLARNVAGYVGLALLSSWLFGTEGLIAPTAYGSLVYLWSLSPRGVAAVDPIWMWPTKAADDPVALAVVAVLLLAGLMVGSLWGARGVPDVTDYAF